MTRRYLLSGSFAYDTVLQHPQAFSQRILPEAVDRLNVSFNVASVEDSFGGCAGNIAYNASLFGDQPMLVGNLGADGERYLQRLQQLGLDTSKLGVIPVLPTAHAWLLTDAQGNQITSFHGGAMLAPVRLPIAPPTLWHIAPEDPVNMVTLALAAKAAGAEYFFDPGQALPLLLEGAARHIAPLSDVLYAAKGIFVNDYEAELLRSHVVNLKSLLREPDQFIIRTRGAQGVEVILRDRSYTMPPARPDSVVDPTGCGDAFRAGFLHMYAKGYCLEACVAMGAVMGALAVGCKGGQSLVVSGKDIYSRVEAYRHDLQVIFLKR